MGITEKELRLWCWRRLLRVLWTARRSHQSILKEINPEYSLEGMMLKLQYFGHLITKRSWLTGNDLDAGKDWGQEEKGGDRGWDGWVASPAQWTWLSANSRRQWRTGKPGMLQFIGLQRVGHNLATEEHQQRHDREAPSGNIRCSTLKILFFPYKNNIYFCKLFKEVI